MSNETFVILGLAVVVLALGVVIVPVVYTACGLIAAYVDERRARSKRLTMTVPPLGVVAFDGVGEWSGRVSAAGASEPVAFTMAGLPTGPPDGSVRALARVVGALPGCISAARPILVQSAAEHDIDAEATGFAVDLIEIEEQRSEEDIEFTLLFGHVADDDGSYWIRFRNEGVVESGYDH